MSEDSIHWLPARELAELVRRDPARLQELLQQFLHRIMTVDRQVNSFITVAEAADLFPRTGGEGAAAEPISPLGGVPFSAKDNLFTTGMRTTMGSKLFESFRPTQDAGAVRQVQAAGGVLVGKANLPEFSSWGRSMNRVSPECRNPWDTTRTCGASSGGSAAGVAAGLVPISIGTDDGGSIRLPSALNGVFGFYPSPGRVPMDGTVVISSVSAAGPITRDVRDAAIFLDAMLGEQSTAFCDGLDGGVAGLQIAWVQEHESLPIVDPAAVETIRGAAMRLRDAGATVAETDIAFVNSWDAHSSTPEERFGGVHVHELAEWARITEQAGWQDQLSPYIDADRLRVPSAVESSALAAQAAQRGKVVGQLHEALQEYDLILSPTIDQVAPTLPAGWGYPYGRADASREESRNGYTKYTMRANLAGCPAASVPAGFVRDMPVGLQIIGRPGEDLMVLRASRALEKLAPWAHVHPEL